MPSHLSQWFYKFDHSIEAFQTAKKKSQVATDAIKRLAAITKAYFVKVLTAEQKAQQPRGAKGTMRFKTEHFMYLTRYRGLLQRHVGLLFYLSNSRMK